MRRRFFDTSTVERQNQARARAFIHLYLAATYGLLDFEEREKMVTDSSNDGGIDAYYIDTNRKIIDIIQSKFRVGSANFESKFITPEEIMAVDLNRILSGYRDDENGQPYNGYILAFIEKLQKLPDIVRYKPKVTILANVRAELYQLVERLFHGDETNIVNFERCYSELVLPTIRGEQHYTSSIRLQLDLSNKSGRSRLNAEVTTAYGASELTVILVPSIEIASVMSRYKNSILRYNPRSYLEFKEQKTNEGIRSSIVGTETGEFAILNNGLTVVSDETHVNERVGSANRAQVELVNPQIINGGQTAFTLARIYEESSDIDRKRYFAGKEVMVRIITLPQIDEASKTDLILNISSATNSQTAVSAIDRSASNDLNRTIAERVFNRTGLLYEPKRGEYFDAARNGYIKKDDIVERSLFTRMMNIACGRHTTGLQRKMMRNTGGILPDSPDNAAIDHFFELYEIYGRVTNWKPGMASDRLINDLAFCVFVREYGRQLRQAFGDNAIPVCIDDARRCFTEFETWARKNVSEFNRERISKATGAKVKRFSSATWKRSRRYIEDVATFIEGMIASEAPPDGG